MKNICVDCHKLFSGGIKGPGSKYHRCFDCAEKHYEPSTYRVVATFKGSEFGILPWFWFND